LSDPKDCCVKYTVGNIYIYIYLYIYIYMLFNGLPPFPPYICMKQGLPSGGEDPTQELNSLVS
jgi:hypothetical protein